ncbi:hypothetical protein P9112_008403 [Eukaryota sp. TZLM1-RC]
MVNKFASLGVDPWLCTTLTEIGFKTPTSVQLNCIPPALSGKDVMGVAQTGSGKTGAFAIPILNKLVRDPFGVSTVVLTPTRELAIQIVQQFDAFAAGHFPLRTELIVGGLSIQDQAIKITSRPHVLIATPGRLSWLIANSAGVKEALKRVEFLVFDEADRMIDPQFASDLGIILESIPVNRQTFYFTATLTEALKSTRDSLTSDDFFFWGEDQEIKLPKGLNNEYLLIPAITKDAWTLHLLNTLEYNSAIIFCSACQVAEVVSLMLIDAKISAISLHSQLPQRKRMASLDSFRNEKVDVLVTTDVSSRGLDISTVDLVLNYDVPRLAVDYVHRAGRTARIGRSGRAITLVSQFEINLLQSIEELIGFKFDESQIAEDENKVLKTLDKVSGLKREAKLKLEEYQIFEKQKNRKRRKGM